MSTAAVTPGREPVRPASGPAPAWRVRDRLGLGFAWFLGLLFCAICAALIIYLAVQGIKYLHPAMLFENPKIGYNQSEAGGFLAPLLGTLICAGIAMLVAIPVGIGVAVWLSEYARPRALARLAESTVEMLAGTPTVVLALFGLVVFRSKVLAFMSQSAGGVVLGESFISAGLMLSLLGLPFVVTATREGLTAIPNHVREASYALGKTKGATIRRVLLPAVRSSVITGSSIGTGHVIGDTAIIVMLLGNTYTLQGAGGLPLLSTLRGTGLTLTSYVYDNAPTGELNHPQQAYAAAAILILLVLVLNLVVDVFARKARRQRWN